ncbi:hypothetical protein ACFQL0_16905 [Haloplanus litoreus]|uniref:hypothetical protein n=1 Tax=Haloplanus litoreus TaxID=767515 RepID=UPI0036099ED3
MTTRRWDNWWSNYYIALGILSVVAAGYLGWMLSRQPVGVGIGGSIGLVVGIYGVAGLLNVGIGLWIRRGSAYAWYVGMGLLVLSVVGSVASGAGQGVGGVAVSGVGLALGYLARDRMLESKSVTTETGRVALGHPRRRGADRPTGGSHSATAGRTTSGLRPGAERATAAGARHRRGRRGNDAVEHGGQRVAFGCGGNAGGRCRRNRGRRAAVDGTFRRGRRVEFDERRRHEVLSLLR